MSDETAIYVDAGQPAMLNDGAGKLTDCATLQEAVLGWLALPSAQKIRATIKVIGGPVYTAQQIHRLHYGPKPPDQDSQYDIKLAKDFKVAVMTRD